MESEWHSARRIPSTNLEIATGWIFGFMDKWAGPVVRTHFLGIGNSTGKRRRKWAFYWEIYDFEETARENRDWWIGGFLDWWEQSRARERV